MGSFLERCLALSYVSNELEDLQKSDDLSRIYLGGGPSVGTWTI